jgi:hypothetical protein
MNKPMQPAAGPAFWPGFIEFHSASTCPLQAAFYCVISAFLLLSASEVPNTALCSPGTAQSRSGARSDAPRTSNSGRYALLIEYEPTAVASTRGSVCLCCLLLLLVPGGWRGLVRVDRLHSRFPFPLPRPVTPVPILLGIALTRLILFPSSLPLSSPPLFFLSASLQPPSFLAFHISFSSPASPP